MRNQLILITFLLALGTWGFTATKASPLRVEAEQVFAFDRAHPHVLPAHKIRALSLALEFQDQEGTRRLLDLLKRR